MVGYSQERLVVGVAAAHGVEADALMGEVHFAAHQAMDPVFSGNEGLAQQMHVALRPLLHRRSRIIVPLSGVSRLS